MEDDLSNPITYEPIHVSVTGNQEEIIIYTDGNGESVITEDDFQNPLYDGEGVEMSSEDYNFIVGVKAFAHVAVHNILFTLANPSSLTYGNNELRMGKIQNKVSYNTNGQLVKDENIIIDKNTAHKGSYGGGTVTIKGYYEIKDMRAQTGQMYAGGAYQEQYLIQGSSTYWKPLVPTQNCGPWNCTFDSTNPPPSFNIFTQWTYSKNLPTGVTYQAYMNMYNWDEKSSPTDNQFNTCDTKLCDTTLKRFVTVAVLQGP
jgi:hypothetical protein